MNESLNPAQEGDIAEYARTAEQLKRDEQRSWDILNNRHEINPVRPNYASINIEEAFDWVDVHEKIAEEYDLPSEQPLFVFAFYSDPKPGADRELLNSADIDAFFEARQMRPDDFLHYFRGEADTNGKVMSFCVWTTPETSQSVIHGEAHQRAAKLAKPSYKTAHVQGYGIALADKGDEIIMQPMFEHSLNVGD